MCTHLRRNLQRKHHFAYTEACASARGRCIRLCAESFSKNIILRIQMLRRLRGAMCTHLHRSFERKHVHWADNVYASVQKASAKTSFCVYRSWGVLEGSCIRFRLGALSESMYTGQTMYTLLFKNLQRNRHFTYTLCRLSRGYLYMDYFVPADCHPKRPPVPSKKAY